MEELLAKSLDQYRQILAELDKIDRMLNSGRAGSLGSVLESWLQLQREARRTDERIAELGVRNPMTARSNATLEAKKALMLNLAGRCREVFGHALTHQALIREELDSLRGGRRAIKGYKSLPKESGNRIRSSQ